jgi:hypothetical protein
MARTNMLGRHTQANANSCQSHATQSHNDVGRWKRLAVEVRERASEMNDNAAQTVLIQIAVASERMAVRQAIARKIPRLGWKRLVRCLGQTRQASKTAGRWNAPRAQAAEARAMNILLTVALIVATLLLPVFFATDVGNNFQRQVGVTKYHVERQRETP